MEVPDWLKNPKKAGRFHAWAAVAFAVQIPAAVFTPLKDSLPYLVFLSLWALVGAHWSAWQAAQAEKKQE
jgi:hypothetical protein